MSLFFNFLVIIVLHWKTAPCLGNLTLYYKNTELLIWGSDFAMHLKRERLTRGTKSVLLSQVVLFNRPLSRGRHFECQGNKKLCFCPSSLALNERLDGQNLLFQQCVIKFYTIGFPCSTFKMSSKTWLVKELCLNWPRLDQGSLS